MGKKIKMDGKTYTEVDQDQEPSQYTLNEFGNAQRLEEEYAGKFCWTKATGWLVYNGGRWVRDSKEQVALAVLGIIKLMETSQCEDERDWALKAGCSKVMNGTVTLAAKLRTFSRNHAAFDRHPELFNVANGTYNLETGIFQPHNPDDLLTKQSPVMYDPEATCPKFEKFLLGIMAGKEHMREFLQRALGYSMSAYTTEPALFMPHGTKGTGKSQFLKTMFGMMGDYAAVATSDMFMTAKGAVGQPFEFAGMEGIRYLQASEVEEGQQLAVAKVKNMTGNESGIRASYKHKDHYTFQPQWKIWLACNDEPTVTAADDAIWDRLKPIPFDIVFRNTAEDIKDISKMLLAEESSGILNWLIAGFNMWKLEGLNYPVEIRDAASEWREEEDFVGRYLEEYTIATEDQNKFVKCADLFEIFTYWAKSTKEGRGLNAKGFSKVMRKKGYEAKVTRQTTGKEIHSVSKDNSTTNRCWQGLKFSQPIAAGGANRWSRDRQWDKFVTEL